MWSRRARISPDQRLALELRLNPNRTATCPAIRFPARSLNPSPTRHRRWMQTALSPIFRRQRRHSRIYPLCPCQQKSRLKPPRFHLQTPFQIIQPRGRCQLRKPALYPCPAPRPWRHRRQFNRPNLTIHKPWCRSRSTLPTQRPYPRFGLFLLGWISPTLRDPPNRHRRARKPSP